jgi:hypothetical protein
LDVAYQGFGFGSKDDDVYSYICAVPDSWETPKDEIALISVEVFNLYELWYAAACFAYWDLSSGQCNNSLPALGGDGHQSLVLDEFPWFDSADFGFIRIAGVPGQAGRIAGIHYTN